MRHSDERLIDVCAKPALSLDWLPVARLLQLIGLERDDTANQPGGALARLLKKCHTSVMLCSMAVANAVAAFVGSRCVWLVDF